MPGRPSNNARRRSTVFNVFEVVEHGGGLRAAIPDAIIDTGKTPDYVPQP
jgi:hypothetical protein